MSTIQTATVQYVSAISGYGVAVYGLTPTSNGGLGIGVVDMATGHASTGPGINPDFNSSFNFAAITNGTTKTVPVVALAYNGNGANKGKPIYTELSTTSLNVGMCSCTGYPCIGPITAPVYFDTTGVSTFDVSIPSGGALPPPKAADAALMQFSSATPTPVIPTVVGNGALPPLVSDLLVSLLNGTCPSGGFDPSVINSIKDKTTKTIVAVFANQIIESCQLPLAPLVLDEPCSSATCSTCASFTTNWTYFMILLFLLVVLIVIAVVVLIVRKSSKKSVDGY